KQYTATAALLFKSNQLGQQIAGLPAAGTNESQQSTNIRLIQLGDVAAKTARLLDHGLTPGEVSAALSVSQEGESNIVNVSATAAKPVLAAEIANTYSKQFVAEQQSSNRGLYGRALNFINKQLAALSPKERGSAAGLELQRAAQSLRVLAGLPIGTVQV